MSTRNSRPTAGARATATATATASATATTSASAPSPAVLHARGISVVIRGTQLLHGIDIDVAAGSVTAILGPNGAGKSTLLGVLAGDITPASGVVVIDGHPLPDVSTADLARRRSVLLQQSSVAFSYTVREVAAMGRAAWRADDADDDTIVTESLAQTDTTHLAHRDVTTLSGGEQGRAAFARVLAQRTPIVLLDEPTAALDIAHQERVLEMAGDLARAGGAVAIVMHDLDAAATHADRVVILAGGRVVAAGSPAEVMTSATLSAVYEHPIDVFPHPVTGRPLVVPARSR